MFRELGRNDWPKKYQRKLCWKNDYKTTFWKRELWLAKRCVSIKPSSYISAMVGDDMRMIAGNKLFCFLRFDRRWSPTIADIIHRRSHLSQISRRRRKAFIADIWELGFNCMENMERFTPLYAIAYAILNGTENLRFDKEGYFHVLVFYGLFYERNRKHFPPCSHTF